MRSITRVLDCGWTFTRIGETDNGEWLETSTFPTSVHVELLHLKKISDPVSSASCIRQRDGMVLIPDSSLASTSGIYNVRSTARYGT